MTMPELGRLDFFGFGEVRQGKIYHCIRVKLKLFRVYIESLTMSSQEPPKNKSKRDNGLFYLYNECTCVRGCHVFCASMHQRVPYGKIQDL